MRNLSPDIFSDEFIGAQSDRLFKLWVGLITSLADDQGRMLDNPGLIKSKIFPYGYTLSVRDIDKDLKRLSEANKIMRYLAGNNGSGRALIQIVNWWRYQTKAQWASRSVYPAPSKWIDRVRCHERGNGTAIV